MTNYYDILIRIIHKTINDKHVSFLISYRIFLLVEMSISDRLDSS